MKLGDLPNIDSGDFVKGAEMIGKDTTVSGLGKMGEEMERRLFTDPAAIRDLITCANVKAIEKCKFPTYSLIKILSTHKIRFVVEEHEIEDAKRRLAIIAKYLENGILIELPNLIDPEEQASTNESQDGAALANGSGFSMTTKTLTSASLNQSHSRDSPRLLPSKEPKRKSKPTRKQAVQSPDIELQVSSKHSDGKHIFVSHL